MGEIEILQQAFPQYDIDEISDYGANIRTPKTTITIYWGNKKKFCMFGKWQRYNDLKRLTTQIDIDLGNVKTAPHIEPQPSKTPIMDYVNDSKTGIDLAIMHILKKRETIMRDQPDNKLAAFCLCLADELKSYL